MSRSSGKVRLPQAPTTLPKLKVPHAEAQQKLETHIAKGQEIVNRPIGSDVDMDQANADGRTWREYAIRLLASLFDTPAISDEYSIQTRGIVRPMRERPYEKERDIFRWWVASNIRRLKSYLESLDLYEENIPVAVRPYEATPKNLQADTLEKIELIANRFHTAVRQLCHRHASRDTLIISDEYDVQDLFHVLLRVFFDDVRDEEWTPSYAGGASRIDFLLKQEQVFVEIKMTRLGLTKEKDVSDQLIIDSERYRVHPDCEMLVAFVYDPQEYLNNPSGVERDLTKTINNVPVKVIIRSH